MYRQVDVLYRNENRRDAFGQAMKAFSRDDAPSPIERIFSGKGGS